MRPGDAGAIHVLSLEGDLVSSFAEIYPTSNPIIRHHLSQGHIACLEGAGLVLHAPQNLPQVRAYDATGVLRWWLEMEGFQPSPGPFDGGSAGPGSEIAAGPPGGGANGSRGRILTVVPEEAGLDRGKSGPYRPGQARLAGYPGPIAGMA